MDLEPHQTGLSAASARIVECHPMTRDLWGADACVSCVPYWLHTLAPVRSEMPVADAERLVRALRMLAKVSGQRILVSYVERSSATAPDAAVDRTFRRGRWLRRTRRLLAVRADSDEKLAGMLRPAWNAAGNETTMVLVGASQAANDFLAARFVDDVEANPINEEGLLPHCEAILSRGWDGGSARIFSRAWEPEEVQRVVREVEGPARR